MKKSQFIWLTLLFFSLNLNAQKYTTSNHEIGFRVGVSNYLGDLAHSGDTPFFGDIQAKAFRPAIGFFYRNNFYKFFNFRTNIAFTQLYGDDDLSLNDAGYENRNLHFKSNLVDFNLLFEWNILPFKIAHYKHRFTPYIAFGIGGFYFNPKAKLGGDWIALQPLGTEGQGLLEYPNRSKYSKISFNLPFGAGFKVNVGRIWAINAEMLYHYTFTDYIDDVSTVYPNFDYYYSNNVQAVADEAFALSYRGPEELRNSKIDTKRGNSSVNDYYFMIMLSASVQIAGKRTSCNTIGR